MIHGLCLDPLLGHPEDDGRKGEEEVQGHSAPLEGGAIRHAEGPTQRVDNPVPVNKGADAQHAKCFV
jgi:hypothetical protein